MSPQVMCRYLASVSVDNFLSPIRSTLAFKLGTFDACGSTTETEVIEGTTPMASPTSSPVTSPNTPPMSPSTLVNNNNAPEDTTSSAFVRNELAALVALASGIFLGWANQL